MSSAKLIIEPLESDISGVDKGNLTFEFDFLPETIEYASLTANYENQTYWYGAGEVMVYTGFNVGSGNLTLTLFARNERKGKDLENLLIRLRGVVMPLRLKGNVVFPPPRFWIRYKPSGAINETKYEFNSLRNLLVRFEDVNFRVISAFPDMTPRLVEVNLTYKEVAYPYRIVTMLKNTGVESSGNGTTT